MPIEILELIVRAEVQPPPQQDESSWEHNEPAASAPLSSMQIAEQVTEILKRKKER